MTFPHLLHDLVGLTGQSVSIVASTRDGHPVLSCAGGLRGAVDALNAAAEEHDVLYFPVTTGPWTGWSRLRNTDCPPR
jgi:hypothetical protein